VEITPRAGVTEQVPKMLGNLFTFAGQAIGLGFSLVCSSTVG